MLQHCRLWLIKTFPDLPFLVIVEIALAGIQLSYAWVGLVDIE